MATLAACEQALATLADRMARHDPAQRPQYDRTLTCTLPDLGVVFGGLLQQGLLVDITRVESTEAQIRLEVSSDDLVALVAGELSAAAAWATNRLRIRAGLRDMLRMRSMF